jgi:hypothetical protein
MLQSAILFLATSCQAFTYSLCSESVNPYAGMNVSVSLVRGATLSVTINGTVVPVTVAGTITIVDGCNVRNANLQFKVTGLSFTGPATAMWYGGITGSTDAATLTDDILVPNANATTYTFRKTAGNWVSYYGFNEIRHCLI